MWKVGEKSGNSKRITEIVRKNEGNAREGVCQGRRHVGAMILMKFITNSGLEKSGSYVQMYSGDPEMGPLETA